MKYSVVTPIYNEENSIQPLYFSLKKVMDSLGENYELIFVNDGSKDKSLSILDQIKENSACVVAIDLKKNLGQARALQAGFDVAKGDIIITIDGDLQNNPEDIPTLLKYMDKGYDLVCGYRHKRKDPLIKVYTSKLAVFLRNIITGEKIHDPGCALRVFKKSTLQDIYLTKGMHRFFTLLVKKLGYGIGEVKVSHNPRQFGYSHYNTRNRIFESLILFMRILLFGVTTSSRRESEFKSSL